MQFTPQQLAGHHTFGNRTLIGNWSEDVQYGEERVGAFLRKKDGNMLLSQAINSKIASHKTPTTLTAAHEDGYIHIGDEVMIQSVETQAFLSVDLDECDKIPGHGFKYLVTAAPSNCPVLRNTWTIVHVKGPDDALYPPNEANVLHYNQPFKLALNPILSQQQQAKDKNISAHTISVNNNKILYLSSELLSSTSFSKVSRQQEAVVTTDGTFNLIWRTIFYDQDMRMEMEGQPVKANVNLLIYHPQTSQPLHTDKSLLVSNDFGREFEVSCFANRGTGTKKRNLPEKENNHWAFVTPPSTASSSSVSCRGNGVSSASSSVNPMAIIQKIRQILTKRGSFGIRSVTKMIRGLSENKGKRALLLLDVYELDNGFRTCGITLTQDEMKILSQEFGDNVDRHINVSQLLFLLRGDSLTDRRLELIKLAYCSLDATGDQSITFDEMRSFFDARQHPDALSGAKTQQQVSQEFLSGWDKAGKATISFEVFLDFYEDLSAAIDDDIFFELMLRNVWHVSGGEGVCKNTSCRRVVVTHLDDSKTIEEIKDDLRIKVADLEAMKNNLINQGITDIKKIQLHSA